MLVDSGGYEARPYADLSEPYFDERAARSWTQSDYRRIVNDLPQDLLLGVVNFDECAPVLAQVEAARADFAQVRHATIFLCKPPTPGHSWIDIDEMLDVAPRFCAFGALGVTEKELGPSPIERCRALIRLRERISVVAGDLPIHVFGCITPLSVLAYFLCGADIFDGLAWLRYSFANIVAAFGAEVAILAGEVETPDADRLVGQAVANLRFLRRLRRAMHEFCERPDMAMLKSVPGLAPYLAPVFQLVAEAGVPTEEIING
jgi:hypothetical protein